MRTSKRRMAAATPFPGARTVDLYDENVDRAELASLLERPSWHAEAACRGAGADAFFRTQQSAQEAATGVCGGCVVRAECLDFALADPNVVGVWGGTTERERRKLRRDAA